MRGFVVRKGKQVVLGVVIIHGERYLLVASAAEERVYSEVFEGVVHPAHVPFIVKAEMPVVGITRGHVVIGAGILGYHHDPGKYLVQFVVETPHELHRALIHAALFLSLPVDDIAHRVNAQSVDVIGLQPEVCRRQQETLDMTLVKIVVVGIPFAVRHEVQRIFVQRRSVEPSQTEAVPHKMNHHKVKYHSYALVVTDVDHFYQLLRRAVSRGGGEHPADVISP